jgi:hypothetical protein
MPFWPDSSLLPTNIIPNEETGYQEKLISVSAQLVVDERRRTRKLSADSGSHEPSGFGLINAHPRLNPAQTVKPVDGKATLQAESWVWIGRVLPAVIFTEMSNARTFRRITSSECFG